MCVCVSSAQEYLDGANVAKGQEAAGAGAGEHCKYLALDMSSTTVLSRGAWSVQTWPRSRSSRCGG
jgi:hypothetical protein